MGRCFWGGQLFYLKARYTQYLKYFLYILKMILLSLLLLLSPALSCPTGFLPEYLLSTLRG